MRKNMMKLLRYGLCLAALLGGTTSTALAIDNAECLQCHSDTTLSKESTANILKSAMTVSLYVDEETFNKSVHHQNGIACVDCHADITELNYDEDLPHRAYLEPVCCAPCHEEEGNAFKNSVHMEIRSKGITMTCYACHGYHDVMPMDAALLAERENSYCLKCHNPYQYHEWLPARESHFAFVECIVCHAPDVPQEIRLLFVDLVTGKLSKGEELLKILGVSQEEFQPLIDTNKDNIINEEEFDNLIVMLRQKSIHARFHAELVAVLEPAAHEVKRGMAEKTCEKCHIADSPYFSAVFILLSGPDGTVSRHEVERQVLSSYNMSHFYLMTGSRIKVLDRIGFLLIAGGAGVVVLHLVIRIATIGNRRKEGH